MLGHMARLTVAHSVIMRLADITSATVRVMARLPGVSTFTASLTGMTSVSVLLTVMSSATVIRAADVLCQLRRHRLIAFYFEITKLATENLDQIPVEKQNTMPVSKERGTMSGEQ